MFERLFIDILEIKQSKTIDIETELRKLLLVSPNKELDRIVRSAEFIDKLPVQIMNDKQKSKKEKIPKPAENEDNENNNTAEPTEDKSVSTPIENT